MDDSLRLVYKHMRSLGCGSLSHANYLAHFTDYVEYSWSQLSVLQAAHACEIFIKARLAQEHPLLIFDSLPKSTNEQFKGSGKLDFNSLVQSGKTIEYSALPEKLWAATGFRFTASQLKLYRDIGSMRNTIQHFAAPNGDLSLLTTDFIYQVIDPFINEHWDLYAVDYCDDLDPHEILVPVLAERGVSFIIPPTLGLNIEWVLKQGTKKFQTAMKKQAKSKKYI